MRSLPLEGSLVVGGYGAIDGPSPFAWAKPVLRNEGSLILVHRYTREGLPEGDLLTPAEWGDALAAGEGFAAGNAVGALSNGMLWLFRKSFHELLPGVSVPNELSSCEYRSLEVPGSTLVILVDERKGDKRRATWRETSFNQAWKAALNRDWALARRYADLAFLLTPGFDAVTFALLHLATAEAGDTLRAAWELDTALRSRGNPFVAAALRLREALRADLAAQRMGGFMAQPLKEQLVEIRKRLDEEVPLAPFLLDAVLTTAYLDRDAGLRVGTALVHRGLEAEAREWCDQNPWWELAEGLILGQVIREISHWVSDGYQGELSYAARERLGLAEAVTDDLDAAELLLCFSRRYPWKDALQPLGVLLKRLGALVRGQQLSAKQTVPYSHKVMQIVRHMATIRGGWAKTSVLDMENLLVAAERVDGLGQLGDDERRAMADAVPAALESDRSRGVAAAANALRLLSVAGATAITWQDLHAAAERTLAQQVQSPLLRKTASRVLLQAIRVAARDERAALLRDIERLRALDPQDYAVRLHLLDAYAAMAEGALSEEEWQRWWAKAVEQAEELKRLSPQDAPGYLRHAQLYEEAGRTLEAADELDSFAQKSGQDFPQFAAVQLLVREGLWSEAANRLVQLLIDQPDHLQAARWLADLPSHLETSRVEALKREFQRQVGPTPTMAQRYVLGAWEKAIPTGGWLNEEEDLKDALRDREVEKAERLLGAKELRGLEPARVSFYRGTIALLKSDVPNAYHHYLESLQSAPTPGAADRLAYCALRLERFDEAEERLRELLQRKPDDGSALFLLGLITLVRPADDNAQQKKRSDTVSLWLKAVEAHIARAGRLEGEAVAKHRGLALRTAVRIGYLVSDDPKRLTFVAREINALTPAVGAVLLGGLERSRCFADVVGEAILHLCHAETPLAVSLRAAHYAMGRGFFLAADRGFPEAEQWFRSVLDGFQETSELMRGRFYAELLAGGKRALIDALRRSASTGQRSDGWLREERKVKSKFEQLLTFLAETRSQASYYRNACDLVNTLRLDREEVVGLATAIIQRTALTQIRETGVGPEDDRLLDALPLSLSWKEAEVWRLTVGCEWADSLKARRVRLWLDEADWRRATRGAAQLDLSVGELFDLRLSKSTPVAVRLSPWLADAKNGMYKFYPDIAFSAPHWSRLAEPDPAPELTLS